MLGVGCWLGGAALAAGTNTIMLRIDAGSPGRAVPDNFVGLSVSSMSIDGDGGYVRCFTTENKEMVALFRQIGVKHVRTIMGKAEAKHPDPTPAQIDAFSLILRRRRA